MSFCSRSRRLLLLAGLIMANPSHAFENFVTREGSQLMDGKKVLRFAGVQAPELHRIEDDARGTCAADKRGWGQYFKWPTADEQENWMQSLAFTGHKVMRTYVLSVEQEFDKACERETHILKPTAAGEFPQLNEQAMVRYDRMIALADKYQIRLILPFIDHWPWWGGRQQLAAFYGEREEDFYNTKSKTYAAYQHIIQQLLTRKNTFTGREYRHEKAIMAWETGNELKDSTADFLRTTSAYIKALDPQHLVMDGNYIKVNDFDVDDPNVDIISNHYYENVGNLDPKTVLADLTAVKGKKAYIIGEFGLLDKTRLHAIADAAINQDYQGNRASGFFIWGLRGHRHDGGFYWHLEPANNKTWSYHLPGFAEGAANEELDVIQLVRKSIAQLNGQKAAAPLPKPLPPLLRPINDKNDIRWLGAAAGRSYTIQRATDPLGKWTTIASKISDGANKFDPAKHKLFSDSDPLPAGRYYYRVIAENESGKSAPSNVERLEIR